MITQAAQRAGFGGGIVVDYPNSKKARKMYLCLMVGQQEIPQGLAAEHEGQSRQEGVRNETRRRKEKGRRTVKSKKDLGAKEWVLKKKELYRTRGKEGYVPLLFDHSFWSWLTFPGFPETPSTRHGRGGSNSSFMYFSRSGTFDDISRTSCSSAQLLSQLVSGNNNVFTDCTWGNASWVRGDRYLRIHIDMHSLNAHLLPLASSP